MAQRLQTIEEIETLFADLICSLTELPSDKVLIQYEPQGQPSAKRSEDVVYVEADIVPEDREAFKVRTRTYSEQSEKYTYSQQAQRTLSIQLVFYGPHAPELATVVNEKMYFESQRIFLKKNNLSLIPTQTDGPRKLHENYNGQWWQRCDLILQFYNAVIVDDIVNTFESYDIRTEVE